MINAKIKLKNKVDTILYWTKKTTLPFRTQISQAMIYFTWKFVQKKHNPRNFSKVRPIEDFWGVLKAKV